MQISSRREVCTTRTGIMGYLVILSVFVLVTVSYAAPGSSRVNVIELIRREDYPVQKLTVQTRDGYLLDLIRIPGPRPYRQEWEASSKKHTGKPVALLMHGLLGSADEFVVGGSARGLAFKLADRGFDVFLANARGSKYARKHTYLNPDEDAAFWRYNWDQIGSLDLPAIIEEVTTVTGQKKMDYIGYNQGNTAFFVMAAKKPEYNSRIKKMIALGPMVYMKDAHNPLMSRIRANLQNRQWISKHLGRHEVNPTQDLLKQITPDCRAKQIDQQVCDNVYFLLNGYSNNFNQTIVPALRQSPPLGVSLSQVLHYAQLVDTDGFNSYQYGDYQGDSSSSSSDSSDNSDDSEEQKYGPGGPLGEAYDLSAVTVHTYLLYVPDDSWSSRQDINKLANDLPNVKETYPFSKYASNVDLILAEDAYSQVNEKILNILQ